MGAGEAKRHMSDIIRNFLRDQIAADGMSPAQRDMMPLPLDLLHDLYNRRGDERDAQPGPLGLVPEEVPPPPGDRYYREYMSLPRGHKIT